MVDKSATKAVAATAGVEFEPVVVLDVLAEVDLDLGGCSLDDPWFFQSQYLRGKISSVLSKFINKNLAY